MLIDLTGRIAIVTGAGRGIGRVIARRLAHEGALVVAAELRPDLVEDLAREWTDSGWPGLQVVCDVRQATACRAVVDATEARFGRLDILVNNAGIARGGPVAEMDPAVWADSLEANLTGTFLMCQAAVPALRRAGAGRIINASSFAAIVPSLGGAAYAASKSGVEALTRVLAGELGPDGITVNCYAPGMIPTDMNGFAHRSDAEQQTLLDTLTLRRWGDPEDVANLVCFLASDQASYITGSRIDISGGKLATQMPWRAWRDPA
jgi:3-oxoacyl-[acyl-carrier protein] reductase